MPEYVNPFKSKCSTHSGDLFHKSLDAPQRNIIGRIRLSTAELIEKDNRTIIRQDIKCF